MSYCVLNIYLGRFIFMGNINHDKIIIINPKKCLYHTTLLKEKKRKLMTSSDPKVIYSCPKVTYSDLPQPPLA